MIDEKISRIILRHGTREDFPNLENYEMGYAYDTNELFIGDEDGNVNIITETQFKPEVEKINNFINDIEYFKKQEDHLIYDQQIGAVNLINNGKFILPIESGKLGLTLIGDEAYPETKIYVEDCSDQGIGNKNCLTVYNRKAHTAGVSFNFIDQHQSTSFIDDEFIITYKSRYENIIPGNDIFNNILRLGQVNLIYDYADGTSENKIIKGQEIMDGTEDWTDHSIKFNISSNKTIDRVYGSLSFEFDDCIGDFSIADIQCTHGNTPIRLGLSDDDIFYMVEYLKDAIEGLHTANDHQHDMISESITEINQDVEEINDKLDYIDKKITDFKVNPENKLRNTGEFSCTLYWKSTNLEAFDMHPSHRYMKLTKISSEGNSIQVQTSESLDCINDFTLTIIFIDNRLSNRDKLDVRLMSGYDIPLLRFEDYEITEYDDIHSMYVAHITRNEIYDYSSIEYVGIYDTDFSTSESIDIKNIKLTLFPYNSEWIPNPKDTVSSIRDYELDVTDLEKTVTNLNTLTKAHDKSIRSMSDKLGSTELYSGKITNRNLYNFDYGEIIEDKSIEYLLQTLFFKTKAPEILSVQMYKFDDIKSEIDNYYVIGSSVVIGKIVVNYESYHINVDNIKIVLSDGTIYHCVINENIDAGIYYFDNGLKLSKTTNFTIILETEKGEISQTVYTIPFNPPISYGSTLLNIEEIGAGEILGQGLFVGNVNANKEIEIPFNHEGEKVFIAIPNMLVEELRYIKDSNCINYLNSFDTMNLRINAVGTIYDYSLYLMKNKTWMKDNLTVGLKGGSIGWQ